MSLLHRFCAASQYTKHTKIQHVTTTYIIMCVDRKTIVCDSKQLQFVG